MRAIFKNPGRENGTRKWDRAANEVFGLFRN